VDAARSDQIRALYKAALEMPASERSAFVAERSAGDASLRESVEFLLSQSDATGVRVDAAAPPPLSQPDLPNGTAIGSYRIESVLGRGGMGTVYRAIDTKLHRSVAIKFLSSALADSQARRRFQQEAETASALNHPHIVTVHDVGEHDGQQYLVSELVDGGTLNDWLAASRDRPWRQSVEMLIGVADAIAAAHRVGIVHRDIKPGNILIGRNGYAKLADFGLAKLLDDGAQQAANAGSHSRAAPTGVGVVVGTVAYMSPEQAAGRPLDERTDVFSFGVVLYEALAGRRPFEAANDLELLKTIAHGAPPPLPPQIPESVRAIVDKALEKDAADRYQHMQDLVVDLRRAVRKSSGPQPTGLADTVPLKRARVAWLVAAGLAVALAAALVPAARYLLRTPPPAQQMRFAIPAQGYNGGLAISPDGQTIAYVATVNRKRSIWLRPIAALEAHAVPGTDDANGPFWSPDNRSLAFVANAKLSKVELSGGAPQPLAETQIAAAGAWSRQGTILFTGSAGVGGIRAGGGFARLARVADVGGAVALVTELDAKREAGHVAPMFLPDGHTFLFVDIFVAGGPQAASLMAGVLGDATTTPVLNLGTVGRNRPFPAFAYANGILFYTRDGTLFAQHFDVRTRSVVGSAVSIAENVLEVSAAETGTLAYVTGQQNAFASGPAPRQFVWFDRAGKRVGAVAAREDAFNPTLSPDGGRLAFNGPPGAADSEIWTVDLARGAPTRRTFEPQNYVPTWSPDGTQILFNSTRGSRNPIPNRLYRRAANGTGGDELVYTGTDDEFAVPSNWSPDGRLVLFERTTAATVSSVGDIWVLPLDGDRKAYPLITSKSLKSGARLSPDARWLAYATDESGKQQIVVQPFPTVTAGKWQVSTNGGLEVRWRSDGRELYYLALDGTIMAVAIRAGETFDFDAPIALFNTGVVVPGFVNQTYYDVAPDGQRFVVAQDGVPPAAENSSAEPVTIPITVVVNGTAIVQR
jgi:eukaryotic-like serine/threonine-protein kinase